jgi:xanthosine utilization system XapX-like protein
VKRFVIHRTVRYPFSPVSLQFLALSLQIDRTRTLRGAVSGAIAAAVWALQQPLDKLVFQCSYDDVELLGKAVVSGDAWYPAGLALHMGNGALFGLVYATVAPRMPLPPALRGPAAGLAEHVGLWPLVGLTDRLHPARQQLPRLGGNRRAFAQAAWRHLLFGFVLGELERRLNAEPGDAPLEPAAQYSSNGHGSLEHALSAES